MQKIRAFFTYIILFSFIWSIFSPLGMAFGWEDKYDYSEYIDKINISSQLSESGMLQISQRFDTTRTTFILAFDNYIPSSPEDIEIEWDVDGEKYTRFLDIEGVDDLSRVTTFPFISDARSDITFIIKSHTDAPPKEALLISSNQESQGKHLTFESNTKNLYAENGVRIISRAEWGADERLRYVSKERREEKITEWISRGKTPRPIIETQEERDHRLRSDIEYNAIVSSDPESTNTYSLERYEGENKLYWPIKKAKKIDRIVIHHTAENLENNTDDMTLLRAIYFYHTRTKGWGDIGYNFIIGGRGDIYEGRAGGDYVEGAHVYGNNMGTVGISLIGNYDTLRVNKDQKIGMLSAIEYVVRKYGINLDEQDIGASLCAKGSSCIWRKVITPRLIGHRDLAATSCPGINLYNELESYRKTIVGKVGKLQQVYNQSPNTIDPVDPEDSIEYVLSGSPVVPSTSIVSSNISTIATVTIPSPNKKITSSGGKPIKIKLSYPHEDISLHTSGNKMGRLLMDGKNIPYVRGKNLSFQKKGNNSLTLSYGGKTYEAKSFSLSSDIITIASWSRIPDWDKLGRYNDNVFRGKITLRNIDGKLLVVNELPIEDYLKGMGEVSESLDVKNYPEKVKALIVAARSYGYYYLDKDLPMKKRKFQTFLYDISDNPDESQVYKGYGYELRSPNYVKLVLKTRSQVVKYNNKVIKVWYSSSAGGKTISYQEYCQSRGITQCESFPYLQSVDDPGTVGKSILGHGVGISGGGASYFSLQGWGYKKIIQYYMKGVEIGKI